MQETQIPEQCELCCRETHLTKHHLIPKTLHNRKSIRKRFSRDERLFKVAWLCRCCHDHIHRLFSEKELAFHYYDMDKLRAVEEVARYADWIKTKPPGFKPKGVSWKKTRLSRLD
ncbi:hypothetical protein [Pleionea sp. CnH1-48]|uniref:hypothetical protein n=1 Tax=Pleionea sp. CnH1-48 TaxID=2954494 RepID=UPI00209761C6|nr:hypothetical protein [Pleionea sp. CnH1-48]MCO7225322.1 hypothetical protein [Pleionea sp. CnH1-48]